MKVDLPKLAECIEQDYGALQVYRENLYEHVSQSAGSHYSDSPNSPRKDNPENPVNMLALYDRIMMGHLVPTTPRMMVSTDDASIRHFAKPFQEWGNRQLKRMKFGSILRRWVKDALYCMGIIKCSITAPTEARFGGYETVEGMIGLKNVDLEDWVWDMRAKKSSECWYMGHRYVARLDHVKDNKAFDSKARKRVQAQDEPMLNQGGDSRISSIGRGSQLNHHSYRDYCELWEIYIPEDNMIVTFDADGDFERPLMTQEWVGPKCGPYHFLMYGEVIGNLMPKAPIMDLIDTHVSFNTLWKKCDNEASEAKTICAYSSQEEAQKVEKAMNGDYVQVSNPKEIGEIIVKGGPNQRVAVWATQTRDLFSRHAGNLDALGGLASQADTLGQEKLVAESASRLVQSMSNRTIEGTQEVLDAIGWFAWYNPEIVMEGRVSVPSVGDKFVTQRKTPMDRFGKPFEEIDLRIDPYSFVSPTPQHKMMILQGVMKDFIIPLLPMFGQPGVGDMLIEYVHMVADLSNTPELNRLLEKLIGVESPVEKASDGENPMPQETTRTYERVSRPGMTDQGQAQVLQQLMAGGENQGGMGAMGLGQMSQSA